MTFGDALNIMEVAVYNNNDNNVKGFLTRLTMFCDVTIFVVFFFLLENINCVFLSYEPKL